MGHAASMSLYDFCNGDPVNGFDPDGRLAKGFSAGKNGRIDAGDPNSAAFQLGLILGGGFQGGVDGAANGAMIVADTILLHQNDDLRNATSDLTGGMYDWSRGAANLGVASGYAAAVIATGGAILEASPSLYVNTTLATNSSLVLGLGGAVTATNSRVSATASVVDELGENAAPRLLLGPGPKYNPWTGPISSEVTSSPRKMFRVWGDEVGPVGGWVTPTPPSSTLSAIRDLALPPGNSARMVSEVTVPAGARYQIGTAAEAFGQPGGATQILLLDRSSSFSPGVPLGPR